MQSVLLYAAETWTILSVDARALEAFHMKCQRQLLQIKWHQFVRNDAIAATTGLPSISETISRRRNALFGHVARLPNDIPAHKALNCQVNLSLGRPPSSQWHCCPGRPRNRWVDQIRNDNNLPHPDLWRRAVSRGHCGETLRPLLAKRWQQQQQQKQMFMNDNNNNNNCRHHCHDHRHKHCHYLHIHASNSSSSLFGTNWELYNFALILQPVPVCWSFICILIVVSDECVLPTAADVVFRQASWLQPCSTCYHGAWRYISTPESLLRPPCCHCGGVWTNHDRLRWLVIRPSTAQSTSLCIQTGLLDI